MSHRLGYLTLGITRASLAEIDDEMRAVRRQYRVSRDTGAVTNKQTGRLIGWVFQVGPVKYASAKYEDGRDLCDEFSMTHGVCTLHRSDTEPVRESA